VTVAVIDRDTSGLVREVTGASRLKPRLLRDIHDLLCTVDVEGSARLGALRWIVARGLAEQLAGRARQTGEFRFGRDHRLCELHCRVSDLPGLTNSNKECTLNLII
jgi:hypothetical protein